MTEQFPSDLRHLALGRDSRTSPQSRRDRSAWVLDIAGPFTPWPLRKPADVNSQAARVANQASALLCVAVDYRIAQGAIWITVPQRAARSAGA